MTTPVYTKHGTEASMFAESEQLATKLVVLTIIATALFGSQALSERAFRLLR